VHCTAVDRDPCLATRERIAPTAYKHEGNRHFVFEAAWRSATHDASLRIVTRTFATTSPVAHALIVGCYFPPIKAIPGPLVAVNPREIATLARTPVLPPPGLDRRRSELNSLGLGTLLAAPWPR